MTISFPRIRLEYDYTLAYTCHKARLAQTIVYTGISYTTRQTPLTFQNIAEPVRSPGKNRQRTLHNIRLGCHCSAYTSYTKYRIRTLTQS